MSSRDDIRRQIEELKAKLAQQPPSPPTKRRKVDNSTLLAPATPSPRKNRDVNKPRDRGLSPTPSSRQSLQSRIPPLEGSSRTNSIHSQEPESSHYVPSKSSEPSTMFSQLKSISVRKEDTYGSVTRTEGFSETPLPPAERPLATLRDESLAIIEELEPGPVEHRPPLDDPHFDRLEPNSGIRLKQRILTHEALQDHLTGRYFLPPSLLYSVVRLQPNKQAYDVPVYGDWVTIAVVAERSDVRFTSGPANATKIKGGEEDGIEKLDDEKKNSNGWKKSKGRDANYDHEEESRKGGKKYVHIKLIDLGNRSRSSSSSTSRASLRGDAQLSLMLFESDYYDKLVTTENGKKTERKIWRGGSGGAFEECYTKLREGAVVAFLNPKVLKPYQNTKNPTNSSILALTPPMASAIEIIGYASDLGLCTVVKRDGKPCRAWVDKRTGSGKPGEDVCEYHIQNAVQRARASRPEFSIGTSGMSTTAAKTRSAYDPRRQWGLKPEGPAGVARGTDGEATYVLGGFVASSARNAPGLVAEYMGREGQARARRRGAKREDEALKALLDRANGSKNTEEFEGEEDSGSTPVSRDALEVVRRAKEAMKQKQKRVDAKSKKRKDRAEDESMSSDEEVPTHGDVNPKKTYSAEMIKRLGFNPLTNAYGSQLGRGAQQTSKTKNSSGKFGGSSDVKRNFQLGPPPGAKVRSGVKAPASQSPSIGSLSVSSRTSRQSEDGSDSDLEIEPPI